MMEDNPDSNQDSRMLDGRRGSPSRGSKLITRLGKRTLWEQGRALVTGGFRATYQVSIQKVTKSKAKKCHYW